MHHDGTHKRPLWRPCSPWALHRIASASGLEYLDGIVYRALQGCAAASAESKPPAPSRHTSLKDSAEVSRAATHRSVLLHQSGWVWSKQTCGGPQWQLEATAPCTAPRRRWASIVMTMNEETKVESLIVSAWVGEHSEELSYDLIVIRACVCECGNRLVDGVFTSSAWLFSDRAAAHAWQILLKKISFSKCRQVSFQQKDMFATLAGDHQDAICEHYALSAISRPLGHDWFVNQ